MSTFSARLRGDARPLLLDGATGTELNRRGVDTAMPLWSAAAIDTAPLVIAAIHADYVAAGAEVITANTFRTHARNLRAAGLESQAGRLTALAVELARSAAAGAEHPVWIAGSTAPLEDCYSPELTPDAAALNAEHQQHAENLAEAGVDLILVETQPTVAEAVAASQAAAGTGLPLLVSFVTGLDGKLLSGESLSQAVAAVVGFEPVGILVNCCPASRVSGMLSELMSAAGVIPCGAYANIGEPDPLQGWKSTSAADPTLYAQLAQTWIDEGARMIGGCCGTTPAHIAALHDLR